MTATQQQQAQNGRSQRPTSLHHRSYSDHHKDSNTAASVSQANLGPQGGDLYSNSAGYSTNGSVNGSMNAAIGKGLTITTTTTTITPLEQLKLSKTARLLQLFIACTSVQPHLPALRYPGYGQQWIRPPCTVDYLRYYIDHQQGSEIMIQCFHLLFADLVHCQWRDEAQWLGVPMAPPDNEAYNVLHQIQKEFMTHNATKIQTLSFSAAHTVEHVSGLLIELGEVRQLELTDLSDPESRVDMVVDFVKWHRKVFGEERLRGITLMEGNTSSDSFSSSTSPTSVPSSPTLFATATSSAVSYFGQVPIMPTINSHHNNIFTVVEMITKLERIDATGWTSCILYLHRIPTAHLKQLWLSFAFPPSETVDSQAARLSDYLERCRTIEQIRVPIRRSDVFKWASNEKKLALICSPILASASTKLLPKIWRIHLQGPSLELMDCIQDAAFAFQDTLQDLEARSRLRVWQPTTLVWDWVMPRLRRLRLEGEISLHFSLETLQRCPALEELSLATATAEDWKFQVPTLASTSPTSQHRKKMVAPGHFSAYDPGSNLLIFLRSREMYRIGVLKKLKNLSLTGSWQIPDMALRRIADQCTQLKELTLDQTTGTTIGGILLAVENMHGLERLNLTLDIADLKLVRIAARKLPLLTSVQLTSLREEY
ncbi:hypothetical protein BGZ58_009733 [Dissophora ornata]|nr:hypothetical protein BGZ58_009733 [Dissophora ornata]